MAAQSAQGRRVYVDTVEPNCKPASILGSRVVRYLEANGFAFTSDIFEADYIVINTCGFDALHERASADRVREGLAKRRPGARVISVGCLNRINPQGLVERFAEVEIRDDQALDELFGERVPMADVREAYLDDRLISRISAHGDHTPAHHSLYPRIGELIDGPLGKALPFVRPERAHLRAMLDEVRHRDKLYVKIGQGCVGNCAYCIIKKARGAPRSRPIAEILTDVEAGYCGQSAVNFVADDCGSYGVDTGSSLTELVSAFGTRFPDLPIELCYLNPYWIERCYDEYLEMFSRHGIASVNVSVQSGSDRVIRLMNRSYRARSVVRFVEEVRRRSPATMIWGHMLINYPGESWADFASSIRVGRHLDFYYAFIYSPRAGTPSSSMKQTSSRAVGKLKQEICYLGQGLRVVERLLLPQG